MQKLKIKNRKNRNLVVVVEKSNPQKNLAFVMHGLSGHKDQDHIKLFADTFKENNFTIIRFDTTNTFGESDGNYEDATLTNYYEDLEDVINWTKNQELYQEPFVLCGHSLGGICIGLFAEKYPQKVKALVLVSTVVSGKLNVGRYTKEYLDEWQKTGFKETLGYFGNLKRLKFGFIEDGIKYDLIKDVDKLRMPVLLIVGDQDFSTPVEHHELLFEKLHGKKEIHIIKDAPHTFRDKDHLDQIKIILNNWIKEIG